MEDTVRVAIKDSRGRAISYTGGKQRGYDLYAVASCLAMHANNGE